MASAQPIHTLMWNTDRSSTRRSVGKESTLRGEDGAPRDVVLEDLSLTGFRISGQGPLSAGDQILVGLAGVGVQEATVIWSNDRTAGCQFFTPISAVEMDRTLTANTVVEGHFTWSPDGGEPAAEQRHQDRSLNLRSRIAIISVCAIGTWTILIEGARLAMAMVW